MFALKITFVSAPARASKNRNACWVVPPATCNVHSIGGTTCTAFSTPTLNTRILYLPLRHPDSAWYFHTPRSCGSDFARKKILSWFRLEEIINFLCLRLYKSYRCWEFLGSVIDPDRELWKIDSTRSLPGPSPLHVRRETPAEGRGSLHPPPRRLWNGRGVHGMMWR